MKYRLRFVHIIRGAFLSVGMFLSSTPSRATEPGLKPTGPVVSQTPSGGSWYFTVSGDSRDCGNLIMPKIANSVASLPAATKAQFYWHLGDLRNMSAPDCDMTIPLMGTSKCSFPNFPKGWGRYPMDYYLTNVWDDFIKNQINPFGELPFFLGIGNHELMSNHGRADFRIKFQKWLTQPALYLQQARDAGKNIHAADLGLTYYHFQMNGVDFIYLDNADNDINPTQFDETQMNWLNTVLAADVADPSIKTIIVGMHAALPGSTSSGHAMDSSCQGFCSGQRVYNQLYWASKAGNKNVYVLASHAHNFQQNIFQTPQHQGQVLPGWIVGTAGAAQYITSDPSPTGECWKSKICYGYLLVEVRADGTINPQFQTVTQDTRPKGDPNLNAYCFSENYSITTNTPPALTCACGAMK
jgi:hypothetical protein